MSVSATSERLLSLEGRGIAVTGGGSGIGRAVALLAAQLGARVTIGDRDPGRLAETAGVAAERGLELRTATLDVVDEAQVDEFVAAAGADAPLWGVVCSAGIGPVVRVTEMSRDAWNEVVEINMTGTFLVTRAAARVLVAQGTGGSMVTVSSAATLFGPLGQVHYAASKGGVTAMTKSLARELGPEGIRVNTISPGAIDTPLYWDRTERATDVSRLPLPRLGLPEDVAHSAVFFLSPLSTWLTGQNMHVNGGSHMP